MDMSFANQALSAEYVVQHDAELESGSTWCPTTSTTRSPASSWHSMGVEIDKLTDEQRALPGDLGRGHLTV